MPGHASDQPLSIRLVSRLFRPSCTGPGSEYTKNTLISAMRHRQVASQWSQKRERLVPGVESAGWAPASAHRLGRPAGAGTTRPAANNRRAIAARSARCAARITSSRPESPSPAAPWGTYIRSSGGTAHHHQPDFTNLWMKPRVWITSRRPRTFVPSVLPARLERSQP